MAKEILLNKNTVEIIPIGKDATVTITNEGTALEKKTFNFNGRVVKNKPTVVATMIVSSDNNGDLDHFAGGRYINKKSSITPDVSNIERQLGSNLKLRLIKIVRDTKDIPIEHHYEIIYTAKEKTNKTKKLKYSISTSARTMTAFDGTMKQTLSKQNYINAMLMNQKELNSKGESRLFTIKGDVGAPFKFTIMKYNDAISEDGSVLNYTETQILDSKYRNESLKKFDGDSNEIIVYRGRIPQSGKAEILQKFPPSVNVSEQRYSINIACVSRKKSVFKTSSSWEESNLAPKDNDGLVWYKRDIIQRMNPTITIKATTAYRTIKINEIQPYGSGSWSVWEKKLCKPYGGVVSGSNIFTVKYQLQVLNPTHNLAARAGGFPLGTPVFSNVTGENTSWTNSDPLLNGGAEIEISNIVVDDHIAGDTGNDKAEIHFTVQVNNAGSKATTFELNIDNHITQS